MNITGSPWIKLNMFHKNLARQPEREIFKLLWFHLDMSLHAKKTTKNTDSLIPSRYRDYLWNLTNQAIAFMTLLYQKFLKSGLTIPESLSAYKISGWLTYLSWDTPRWLTQLLFRYGWFKNPAIWLAQSIFNHVKLKIYKPCLTFLASISLCQKPSWFINLLKYKLFRNCSISMAEWIIYLTHGKNLQTIFYVSWIYRHMR